MAIDLVSILGWILISLVVGLTGLSLVFLVIWLIVVWVDYVRWKKGYEKSIIEIEKVRRVLDRIDGGDSEGGYDDGVDDA